MRNESAELNKSFCTQNYVMLYTSGIQPGVREDTLRFSFLSFKTRYLIHYFGCNLFYLF
jgi:hypothetical protein